MERLSRTVMEETTSPRASFSLTGFRRISLAAVLWLKVGHSGYAAKALGQNSGQGVCLRQETPPTPSGPECHEVRYQLQVGQRPGFARGMGGAARTRRLLPADRPVRDDRPD